MALAGADRDRGVNPARAGMIRVFCVSFWVGRGKPRASGDDPPSQVST